MFSRSTFIMKKLYLKRMGILVTNIPKTVNRGGGYRVPGPHLEHGLNPRTLPVSCLGPVLPTRCKFEFHEHGSTQGW